MKYSFIKSALMLSLGALVFAGCNVTSHTEKAAGVNFSNYKTFSWVKTGDTKKADRADNDIIDNNIKNSVAQELTKKGWTETDRNPDVILDYTVAVKHGTKRESAPVYSYPFSTYIYGRRGVYSLWYPSSLIGIRTRDIPFKEGELSVNMMDAKNNKLIWQGWAQGEINSKTVTTKEVTQQVKSIFKKFDYPG